MLLLTVFILIIDATVCERDNRITTVDVNVDVPTTTASGSLPFTAVTHPTPVLESSTFETTVTPTMEDEEEEDIEQRVSNIMNSAYRKALPIVTRLGFDPAVSVECSASLLKLSLALRRFEPWAIHMLDASGKVAPGLLAGTIGDLGNFDECLAITVENTYGEEDFRGRFCTIYMDFRNNSFVDKMVARFQEKGHLRGHKNPLNWVNNRLVRGVRQTACIPSTCSDKDLEHLVNIAGKKIGMKARIRGCKARGDTVATNWQKGIIYTLATMMSIVLLATGADTVRRLLFAPDVRQKQKGSLVQLIRGFSIVSNTEKLLKIEPSDPADSKLQFIHGLRFYSATWVMLGHAFLIADPTGTGSLMNVIDLVKDFMTTVIANAFPSVETFLFISGFLLSYNVQKSLRSKRRLYLWVPLALLRRYIRLTAPAIVVVGIWLIVPLVFDGPILNDYKQMFLGSCEKSWWAVLVHTNNFSPFWDMCLGHLWYIDIDYQLYLGLIIIPVIMISRPHVGTFLAVVASIASIVYVAVLTYLNGYQPSVIFTDHDIDLTVETVNQIYFRPFAHVGPFCIGIVLGYYIHAAKKIKLSKPVQFLFWSAATTVNITVVFTPHKWYLHNNYSSSSAGTLLYASLHRVAWTLGVAWVTFACATGRGGIVKSLLSWNALVPLSRLSYGAFLAHVVILLTQVMTNRERIAFTHMTKTMNYFAVVMASYMCGYLLYLFCEAPVATVERILLGGGKKDTVKSGLPISKPFHSTNNNHHVQQDPSDVTVQNGPMMQEESYAGCRL
ncbi:nose resistant to fluoxetine protein 6-like [Ornithodoros turicata]|uniref:nose resistant to fluoxetine protein 6-like n=1 Tax=Ornithodoros turicata TaxID=34597 RepID=UPI0031393A71